MSRIRTESNCDRTPPADPNPDESVAARKGSRSFRETLKRKQYADRRDSERPGPSDDRQPLGNSFCPRVVTNFVESPEGPDSVDSPAQRIGRVLKALDDLTQTRMQPGIEYSAAFSRLSAGLNGMAGRLILKDRMLHIELIGEDPRFLERLCARIPELRARYGLTDIRVDMFPSSDVGMSFDDASGTDDGGGDDSR